jgi:anaerobic magnesium-protoporphyrin IX monomethyl ester cyclase
MFLIANPPHPPGCVSNKDTMGGFGQIYEDPRSQSLHPMDVLYVAAVLRKASLPVAICDAGAARLSMDAFVECVRQAKPDVLGIRTSTPTIDWDLEVAGKIRSVSGAKIVFFGPHATFFAEEIVRHPSIDGVVLGEAEAVFVDLASSDWSGIEGLAFKRDGVIQISPRTKYVEDLDRLPFPAWDMVAPRCYVAGEYIRGGDPFFTVLASRGCPFDCAYCPYPVAQGHKWRARSAKNIADEIQFLIEKHGMKGVLFRDPEFTLNRSRVEQICHEIGSRGLKFAWRCETRIDTVDRALLTMMAEAGCVGINFGIETTQPESLARIGRKPVLESEMIEVIAHCRKLHLETFCFFMIGLPDDDAESVMRNILFSVSLDPELAQFTAYTPYPGTRLGSYFRESGLMESSSFAALTSYRAVVKTHKLSRDEIDRFQLLASELWKRVLANRQAARLEIDRLERDLTGAQTELTRITSRRGYKIARAGFRTWKAISRVVFPWKHCVDR